MTAPVRTWIRAFSKLHKPTPPPLVLFETSKFLIVNKPSGAAIQGQHGSIARLAWDSLITDLTARPESPVVFPVHRLDKATTGCLILAKSADQAKRLAKQFQSHDVKRTYLAVVHGALKLGYKGKIETRLQIDKDREKHSLLRLDPATGRKHQLRVHCSETLKASVVGDYKYGPGDPHMSVYDLPPNEMLLHSFTTSLYVWDKLSGKRSTVRATAPVPRTFASFCATVGLELPPDADGKATK
ncbi:hypothetical protein RQP46_004254 [Phenoliferia psychrophenolica]